MGTSWDSVTVWRRLTSPTWRAYPTSGAGCAKLESIHLDNLWEISPRFLANCWQLKSVVITGLQATREIKNYCLGGCRNLTTLELPPLTEVNAIRGNFLGGCKSLKSVTLRGMGNMHTVDGGFLSGCVKLHADINFSELVKLDIVGPNFMKECPTEGPAESDIILTPALMEALELRTTSSWKQCSTQ